MNHVYGLVWSAPRRCWLVVCELTRRGGKPAASPARKARRAAAAALSLGAITHAATADPATNALPTGAQIAAGQAAITQAGNQLKIQQSSAKAIINWQSFDIGKSAEVQFAQPNSSSVTLNRVQSGAASQIYGKLVANGQVFLLNQNGVIFGQGARVDVGGIVAGAMKITDSDFLASNYHFTEGKGVVTNKGTINASDGGMIALLAPEVRNEGVIRARLGTIVMAAGEAITLTNSASGLTVVVDKGAMKALVENRQLVWAEDGRVFMSAMAASAMQAAVINNSGTIEAQSAHRSGNTVRLSADSVENSGTINVAGTTPSSKGGSIAIAANDIAVKDGARLDASGPSGGGDILVGGGWQGSGDMRQATHVTIEKGATLDASATHKGDGGTVVAWSDVHNSDSKTTVLGTLHATGGAKGGNGGRIETSGHQVDTDTIRVDASAAQGMGGLWLIDPYDYTINATAAGNIATSLNSGTSVTVSTQSSVASYGGGASGSGDITVASPISKTAGGTATLTLQADRNIIVNSAITSTSGLLNITLSADNAGSTSVGGVNLAANLSSNGGMILIGGAAGTSSHGIGYARNSTSSTPAVQIGTNVTIQSGGGQITLNGTSTGTASGYSGTKAGIYVLSGATINSGGGNLFMSGISTGDTKEFGFAVEGASGTTTSFTTSTGSGYILLDAQNTLDANGALGLVNSGNQARIQFSAPSVAGMIVTINGSTQATSFTIKPPCGSAYPNCGTMLVPGSNNSYLYATYNAVNMATHALWVNTSTTSRTYDGTTAATGLSYTTTAAPADFSTSGLVFTTPSKNAGTYYTLNPDAANPTTFHSSSAGYDYAVGYFFGNYTINPKTITISATNKVYDGTTAAALTSSGAIGGDSLGFTATGGFSDANYGLGKTVNVSNITLTGTDAANYTVSGTTLVATADITKRPVDLTANRTYDGTTSITAASITLGNLVSGESLTLTGTGSVATKTAGNSKALSLGTLALGSGTGGSVSNYTLTGGTDLANISPVVLNVSGLSAQNKVYDGTTSATLSRIASLSGVLGSDNVQVSGTSGTFADKNVGTGKTVTFAGLSLSGTDAANYTLSGASGTATANITAAPLSITTSDISKVYDGGLSASGTAVVTGGTQLFGSDSLSGGSFTFTDKNAGSGKTVTVSSVSINDGNSGGNYSVSYVNNTTSTITKAAITAITGITASNKTYDTTTSATLDTSAASFSGKVGSDVLTVASASGAFADKNAGTGKTVNVSSLTLGGTDAGNYTLSSNTASTTANITKASLTISGVAASNKSYDGTTAATLNTASASITPLGSDVVSLVASGAVGSFADKNVGTAKAVTVTGFTASGTDSSNYTLVQPSGLTGNITAASLSITTSNVSKIYDGGLSASGTAVVTGGTQLFGSDSLSGGSFAFTDKNAGTGNKTVTVASVTVNDGNSGGNYTVSYVNNTTSTITKAAIAAISGITASNKTYDATTTATLDSSAVSFSGKISGDVLTVGTATGSFADKNAGNGKTVTITGLTLGGTDAGNYTLTSTTGSTTANITKATISGITGITASNKTYDGTTSASLDSSGAIFAGKISGDVLSVASLSSSFADKNAGTGKTVNLTGLSLGGNDAGNYTLASTTGSTTADIAKRSISLTTTTVSKEYDGGLSANGTATLTSGTLASGDSLSGGSFAFTDKNAGTNNKTVTVSNVTINDGNSGGNYNITYLANTASTITPAELSVSGLTIQSKTYDGTDTAQFSGTPSLVGVLGSDAVGFSGTVTAHFADKNAGTGKAVDIQGLVLSGADSANYTLANATASATANITPVSLVVTTGGVTKVYDGTLTANGSATVTGGTQLFGSDSLSGGSFAFTNKNAGTGKTVTVSGVTVNDGNGGGNYNLTYLANTTSTITKATIAAVTGITASNKTYDGTTATTLSSGNASFTGKIAGDVLTLASATGNFADKNAGNGKTVTITGLSLGGADAGNYTLANTTGSTAANITKAVITSVSGLTATNKTYDGTTAATLDSNNAAFSGKVSGDVLTIASANGTFADKNAGNGKTVTITGLSLGGADAGNYTLTSSTGSTTANITPAQLALAAPQVTKAYDGTTAASGTLTITAGQLLGSDTLSGGTLAFSDKNAGTGKMVTLSGVSLNDGNGGGNYTVRYVANTASTITRATISAVTGITASSKTYDGTTAATLDTSKAILTGTLGGDSLIIGSATGSFADKNAGTNKPIVISGFTLSGADAGNYVLNLAPVSASATILPKAVVVVGTTVADKTFDGNTNATLSGATLNGLITSDQVTLGNAASGTFVAAGPANGITVATAMTLTGTDAANYVLQQPTGLLGNITASPSQPRQPETATTVTTPVAPVVTAAAPSTTGALVVPAEATAPIIAVSQPASVQQVALASSSAVPLTTGSSAEANGVTQGFTAVRNFDPLTVASGSPFSFVLPSDTFTHSDTKATIAVTATTAAGGALPDWLSFSEADRRFTGTAPQGVSQFKVIVKARDQIGNEVSSTLTLTFGQSQRI